MDFLTLISLLTTCGQRPSSELTCPARLTHRECWQLEHRFCGSENTGQCSVPGNERGNNAKPPTNLIPGSPTTTAESPNTQGQEGKVQEQEYTHQGKVGSERSKEHQASEDCPTE